MTDKDIIEILAKKDRRSKLELATTINVTRAAFYKSFTTHRNTPFRLENFVKMLDLMGYEIQVQSKGQKLPHDGYVLDFEDKND